MRAFTCIAAAATLGCTADARSTPIRQDVPYACASDSDCDVGRCLREFGFCARESGAIDRLLFEVTPRTSDPIYGGARFIVERSVSDVAREGNERGIKPGWLELNVPPRVPVRGSVMAAPDQTACLVPFSPGRTTLPATLTFTPRQRLIGVSVQSYDLSTVFLPAFEQQEHEFRGALPPGPYDVYMRPSLRNLDPSCRAIPQVFRNQRIGSCNTPGDCAADSQFMLQPPSVLRLTIEWQPNLDGWHVDMVHPVTGEIISNRVELRSEDVAEGNVIATLNYSRADADFIREGEELVRLTPPSAAAATAGTVLLQRSGLELLTAGEGQIGDVSTFGSPVDYQAWVWKQGEPDSPVPGTVTFDALDLDDVPEGVPVVSFSASTEVSREGQIRLSLLPGSYRVRVTPPALDDPALGLLSAFETTARVWPSAEAQAGHVIEVPPAIALEGIITTAHGTPLRRMDVRASASPELRACAPLESAAATDAGAAAACERQPAQVLRKALAQDAFVPRTGSTLSDGRGNFTIDGLDCGPCEEGTGAAYDVTVRPSVESGLAWLVRPALNLDADRNLEPLELPVPVARGVQLTYGEPSGNDPPVARPLPGALVRVFALIDNGNEVVNDSRGLPPCVALARPDGTRCLQHVRQVAEVRSDDDGEFLLLVPPKLE